jgi:hypothetical protein
MHSRFFGSLLTLTLALVVGCSSDSHTQPNKPAGPSKKPSTAFDGGGADGTAALPTADAGPSQRDSGTTGEGSRDSGTTGEGSRDSGASPPITDDAAVIIPPGPGNGSLIGSQVTFSVHCCSSPVGTDNLKSKVVTATVGSGIEFPGIRAIGATVINVDVDLGPNYIKITFLEDFSAFTGGFDGYEFDFSTAVDAPHVVGATISPESNTLKGVVTPVLNADTGQLLVDIAGLPGTTKTVLYVVLDVESPSAGGALDAGTGAD